ncbi:MAG TPA: N-acetyltransferase [Chromatiales bacterium]|nr:N-acetyltransferase [Thiotrichales bacterium]HIP67463.1 N-acetyltransferase [Chromatiales bacterium]
MDIKIHNSLDEISSQDWNKLVKNNNPFLKHEFLSAMEKCDCVGDHFGWLPRHISIYERGELIGAMPLYEKYNSYGEFVFDHAWADAYERHGLRYFPKLVSAIPYTPATGQRLLATENRFEEISGILVNTLLELANEMEVSSFHCLFPEAQEIDFFAQQQFLIRHDVQFHWQNKNYQSFEEFLTSLNPKKRKNIRQERRKVNESGVRLRVLDGHTATEKDWQDWSLFYKKTFDEKWGTATFNYDFFSTVAGQLPDQVVLVLADLDNRCIAGSLMYKSDTTLYGRHWGCIENINSLHFEACYYQGIEHCIKNGIKTFEPGAQGEHKIARGFLPTRTRSAHWLADDQFRVPIENFVAHEKAAISDYMQQLEKSSPYKPT